MKYYTLFAAILIACVVPSLSLTASATVVETEQTVPAATQEGVAAWAQKYYNKYEPQLKGDDKETIDSIKTAFFMNKGVKYFMDKAINDMVSVLTVSLTSKKSFALMACSSALLVENAPKNARVINLFASVLNAADKDSEALPIYEYALSLKPNSYLLRLNVANAYLDADKDEEAKKMLDKLKFELPEDKAVWRALATYYYKKKNAAMFRECLFKAAKFKGYVKKKKDAKKAKVDENTASEGESVEKLEQKAKELSTVKPFTSADVIEDEYPGEAAQIRDKYSNLQMDEKWTLPLLPQCNTSDPKAFKRSRPILKAWVNVFAKKSEAWAKFKLTKMGVNVKASKKAMTAQAKKAAMVKVGDYMSQAQDMLKYMKNIPGMTGTAKYKMNQLQKKMQEAANKKNLKLKSEPNQPQSDEESEEEQMGIGMRPDIDSGSPWAYVNYLNYVEIQRTYELYFAKYYMDFQQKAGNILETYGKFSGAEVDRYQKQMIELTNTNAKPEVVKRAMLMHKQRMNSYGLSAYIQMVNLYMPQYTQKMKPMLDSYWDISMIYVRSMTDPKIMEREFIRVKDNFIHYATIAGSALVSAGFEYYPETNAELDELNREIAAAEKEAKERAPQFERAYQSPEFDWTKWLVDHFVVEIAFQVPESPVGFALKVTAKEIQVDLNVAVLAGGIKYKPIDNILETSTGIVIKGKMGINVCGIGGEVGSKTEIIKRTATWDFDKNTYTETTTGSSEVKLKIGDNVAVAGKAELDSELNSKYTSKFTSFGDFTVQGSESYKDK